MYKHDRADKAVKKIKERKKVYFNEQHIRAKQTVEMNTITIRET